MSATWSCRPGAWFGVFGDHAAVLLPGSEKARVAPVWELVDDGAGFDETLDALISSGLRDLPAFVLVGLEDARSGAGGETRVVLRGAARARLTTPDEVVDLEGEQATTWVERTLHGVSRIRLEGSGDPGAGVGGEELVLARGLLRVASASWGAAADTDHDGLTGAGTPTPERALPGIPGQPPAPAVTRPVARLELSTGESVEVDRVVLVGRAPEDRGAPGATRLVAVRSPLQEVSATHLEVRPGTGADHGAAVVTDLGSTNGTVVRQPGLPPEDLTPGVPVQLVPGAVVDLGDGVRLRVVTP